MQDESLPGARLRRAREEKGLSREDVSRDLRLSMAYLKALEEDDYDKLPEPAFVKGYLRNYARLLGLSAEELAGLFQQQVDRERAHVEARAEQETPRRSAVGTRDWRLPALIVLVVLVILAVGWLLWPHHQPAPPVPAGDNGANASQSQPSSEGPATGQPAQGTDTNTDQQNASGAAAPEAQGPAGDQGAVAPTGGDAAEQASAAGSDAASAPPAPTPTQAQPQPAQSAPSGGAVSHSGIAMSFSRACWIKVVDKTGKTLTQGVQKSGSSVNLDGKPPFRVTIGDAGAVTTVTVDGKPANLPSHRSGDVIHVTLP